MAANTSPIFTNENVITFAPIVGADATTDGTDADVVLAFTADATDGSFVEKMILQPRGTSTSAATFPAGVFRLYINNGSSVGTGTNNSLIREHLMTVHTSGLDADSTTLLNTATEIGLNLRLPPSYRLYVGYTGALTSAIILQVTTIGANY